MIDHPTPAEIAGLVRGTLSRNRRQRLVAHLLHGCPRCARLLVPALAMTPVLLERFGRRGAVRRSRRGLGGPAAPTAGHGAPGQLPAPLTARRLEAAASEDCYERPVARACAAAVHRFQQFEIERQAAAAEQTAAADLAAEHDSSSPGAEPRRLRGLLKVEMLLAASWDLRYSDPHAMVRIAELALFAAERLEQERYGRAVIADVRARTWAELANAHRAADDIAQAEQAMARAVSWQSRGSGDPWLVACLADLMASLFADQRRFAEARELLGKVNLFYRRMGDDHLAGRVLIKHGIFAGYDNDPRGALVLLTQGLELIDSRREWRLEVQAVQAILWNLVDWGRYRQARIHLWRSRPLLVRHGGRLHLLRVRWLEGRIHAGLGELGRAERELLATRLGFEAAGSPYNAALVSLDLAAVWLQQGKTKQVRQLVEEMIATFRALRIAREAVAALLILRDACDRDEATLDRLRAVTVLLTELERQPQRRPGSEPVD